MQPCAPFVIPGAELELMPSLTLQAYDTGEDWANVWLSLEPSPRLVVDFGLKVLWRNHAAHVFLQRSSVLHVRDDVLGAANRKIGAQLQTLTWNAKPNRPTSAVVGLLDDGAVLITGVRLDGSPGSGLGLTIREVEVDSRCELPDLEPTFGLTPAEQQVLSLLLAGLSSAEISRELHKSIMTVRTHVKHAYAKLAVSSKEQLFAKLLRYGVVW